MSFIAQTAAAYADNVGLASGIVIMRKKSDVVRRQKKV
jgi:hypothetical protein